METIAELEAAAREAADRAGQLVRERFTASRAAYRLKDDALDLVTETDRASEAAILEVLRHRFPAHAVVAEESGAHGTGTARWLVDPLDGTTNFAHGYPQISISIAFERAGRTEFGLVLDPIRGETFIGRRDGGATLNDVPLQVSPVEDLGQALLATGFPYDRRRHADFYLAYFKAFMLRTQGMRRAGSAALDLCFVAAGRVDGFWEWNLHAWDVAAGALIVEEAGGRVSDFRGAELDPFAGQILATNGRIHDAMREVIAGIATTHPDRT
jgi:myo-inositol-1(or 4)-monophosphatase